MAEIAAQTETADTIPLTSSNSASSSDANTVLSAGQNKISDDNQTTASHIAVNDDTDHVQQNKPNSAPDEGTNVALDGDPSSLEPKPTNRRRRNPLNITVRCHECELLDHYPLVPKFCTRCGHRTCNHCWVYAQPHYYRR
jgi:hypothetical protein